MKRLVLVFALVSAALAACVLLWRPPRPEGDPGGIQDVAPAGSLRPDLTPADPAALAPRVRLVSLAPDRLPIEQSPAVTGGAIVAANAGTIELELKHGRCTVSHPGFAPVAFQTMTQEDGSRVLAVHRGDGVPAEHLPMGASTIPVVTLTPVVDVSLRLVGDDDLLQAVVASIHDADSLQVEPLLADPAWDRSSDRRGRSRRGLKAAGVALGTGALLALHPAAPGAELPASRTRLDGWPDAIPMLASASIEPLPKGRALLTLQVNLLPADSECFLLRVADQRTQEPLAGVQACLVDADGTVRLGHTNEAGTLEFCVDPAGSPATVGLSWLTHEGWSSPLAALDPAPTVNDVLMRPAASALPVSFSCADEQLAGCTLDVSMSQFTTVVKADGEARAVTNQRLKSVMPVPAEGHVLVPLPAATQSVRLIPRQPGIAFTPAQWHGTILDLRRLGQLSFECSRGVVLRMELVRDVPAQLVGTDWHPRTLEVFGPVRLFCELTQPASGVVMPLAPADLEQLPNEDLPAGGVRGRVVWSSLPVPAGGWTLSCSDDVQDYTQVPLLVEDGQVEQREWVELVPEPMREVEVVILTERGESAASRVIVTRDEQPMEVLSRLLAGNAGMKMMGFPLPARYTLGLASRVRVPAAWSGATLHCFTPEGGLIRAQWNGEEQWLLRAGSPQALVEVIGYKDLPEVHLVIQAMFRDLARKGLEFTIPVPDRRAVTLRGLPTGDYRVTVNAVDSTETTGPGSQHVKIRVTPPRQLHISQFMEDWPTTLSVGR